MSRDRTAAQWKRGNCAPEQPLTSYKRGICATQACEGGIGATLLTNDNECGKRAQVNKDEKQDGGHPCTRTIVEIDNGYHNNFKADNSKLCDNRNAATPTNFTNTKSVHNNRTKSFNDSFNSEHIESVKPSDTLLDRIPNLYGLSRTFENLDYRCLHRGWSISRGSSSKLLWTSFLLLGLPSLVQPSYSDYTLSPSTSNTLQDLDKPSWRSQPSTSSWRSHTPTSTAGQIPNSFSSSSRVQLDLVTSLNLHNTSYFGMEYLPGPHYSTPALHFKGNNRSIYFDSQTRDSFLSIVRNTKEFTLTTSIRQLGHNTGSIIALTFGKSHAYRYFEIQSSGRRNELRLLYWPKFAVSHLDVQVETFPVRVADDRWHKLGVSVSGNQVDIYLDCVKLHSRVLLREIDTDLPSTLDDLTLWLGQRNPSEFIFKGFLHGVKLIGGRHGFLTQCPDLSHSCPTCGQFTRLQDTIDSLVLQVEMLTNMLADTQQRVIHLEDHECHNTCQLDDGKIAQDKQSWTKDCDICTCKAGNISCTQAQCPALDCAVTLPPKPGTCCPTCGATCTISPKHVVAHGEVAFPTPCKMCTCNNGAYNCSKVKCPDLSCPNNETILEDGKCCRVCRDTDWCRLGNNCHEDAECFNHPYSHHCKCKTGFQGNGTHCVDIDECLQPEPVCTEPHNICVNTHGGKRCECEAGYEMKNETCYKVDPCEKPVCGEGAECHDLGGGRHSCTCLEGYQMQDGGCTGTCKFDCGNGGSCVGPDKCSCAPGFHGDYCELDVDECASDISPCAKDSVCINMVGWFLCTCPPGYASHHDPRDSTHRCVDVDECGLGTASCPAGSVCVNTAGGYDCQCPGGATCADSQDEVTSETSSQCAEVACDCTESPDPVCCPDCYANSTCKHQGSDIVFKSGDRWIYECMQCECLNGETDCWRSKCPGSSYQAVSWCPGSGYQAVSCCPALSQGSCNNISNTHDCDVFSCSKAEDGSPVIGTVPHRNIKDETESSDQIRLKTTSKQLNTKTTFSQNGATQFVEKIEMPGNGYNRIKNTANVDTGIKLKHRKKYFIDEKIRNVLKP